MNIIRYFNRANRSVRVRLLLCSLVPLVIAFPVMIGLVVIGSRVLTTHLLERNAVASLTASKEDLQQMLLETTNRLETFVGTNQIGAVLKAMPDGAALASVLAVDVRRLGLDYLTIVDDEGRVLASSEPGNVPTRVASHVVRESHAGLTTMALEEWPVDMAASVLPQTLARRLSVIQRNSERAANEAEPPPVLLAHVGVHLPLSLNRPDAILLGGFLVNGNAVLTRAINRTYLPQRDRMSEISALFVASRTGELVGIDGGDSALLIEAMRPPRMRIRNVAATATDHTMRISIGGEPFRVALTPMTDGQGNAVAVLGVAVSEARFWRAGTMLVVVVALLLAAGMACVSWIFNKVGSDIANRAGAIREGMKLVKEGQRDIRIDSSARGDDIDSLAADFNMLLDALSDRDRLRAIH